MRVDALCQGHCARVSDNLLDHHRINMGIRHHGDACVAGVMRLVLHAELLEQRCPVAVVVVAVVKVLAVRRVKQVLTV